MSSSRLAVTRRLALTALWFALGISLLDVSVAADTPFTGGAGDRSFQFGSLRRAQVDAGYGRHAPKVAQPFNRSLPPDRSKNLEITVNQRHSLRV